MIQIKSPSPILILAMASLPALVHAQSKVGLQFVSDRQAAGLNPDESAGTTLTEQINWNYTDNSIIGENFNIISPIAGVLVDDTGTDSGIAVSWSADGSWNTGNGITTPSSKLLNGYLDHTGTGSRVDFADIPYETYSVVVYFGSDGNGRTGQINSDTAGISYSYTTASQFGRAVTQADFILTSDTTGANPPANYCIFTNQTTPEFSVNIVRGSNNSGFHAVQIVEGGDTDNDGMPDSYETANGLNPLVDDRAGDLDTDGSTNYDEYLRNTKPNDPDTDADGLKDGVETKTGIFVSADNAGTDPLVADTDRDGLSDGVEATTGEGNPFVTDPVKRDTDGDGYTDGYETTKVTDPTDPLSNPSVVAQGAISINFAGGYNGVSASVTGAAGAGAFARENWNNKEGLAGFYSPLVDAANAAVDAGVTWSSAGTWAVVDPAANVPADANSELMSGYLDTSDVSTTSVTVENLPWRRYDVVLYVDGDSGDGSRSGDYTVNGVTRTEIRDAENWPVAFGEGIFTEAVGSSTSGNYLVFRNVAGGTLNITATPTNAAAFRAPLNAVQIFGTLDGDGDGMPDQYELDNGFDPLSPADGPLDADTDGLSNAAEYLKGTLPRNPDSDADGLQDGVETGTGTFVSATNTGTDPLNPDSDADGLSDGQEVSVLLTNPLLRDTDGDGYGDNYEVLYATEPTNAASPAVDAVRAIGIHFNNTPERELAPAEEAGFLLTRQTNWNNADTSTSGSTEFILSPVSGSLVDNTGAATPVTITWFADTVYATTNGTATGDSKLIGGYLDNTGSGSTITISDIPYAAYDVIVYFGSDGNGRTGSIYSPTSEEEFFFTTAANIGAAGFAKDGYRETTSTDGTSVPANFARFEGLTSPVFDVQLNRGDNNSGIFGIQIVQRGAAPAVERIPVTSVTRNEAGAVTIVWESTAGATYRVERSESLGAWTVINPSIPSGGASTSYQDTTLPANTPKAFYRIQRN